MKFYNFYWGNTGELLHNSVNPLTDEVARNRSVLSSADCDIVCDLEIGGTHTDEQGNMWERIE